MLARARQEEILRIANSKGSVTVNELVQLLNSSESTIRRDIIVLDEEGMLTKVFGGAVSLHDRVLTEEPSVEEKSRLNTPQKIAIASFASTLIEPRDLVFIDAGTTTGSMIDFIKEKNATYVTNAILHAKRLADRGFDAILIGGTLKSVTDAVVGAEAVLNIQKHRFSKSFMGTNGMHLKYGCTTPDSNEASTKSAVVQSTARIGRYVLADSDKYDKCSRVTFGKIEQFTFISDKSNKDYSDICKIIVANGDSPNEN